MLARVWGVLLFKSPSQWHQLARIFVSSLWFYEARYLGLWFPATSMLTLAFRQYRARPFYRYPDIDGRVQDAIGYQRQFVERLEDNAPTGGVYHLMENIEYRRNNFAISKNEENLWYTGAANIPTIFRMKTEVVVENLSESMELAAPRNSRWFLRVLCGRFGQYITIAWRSNGFSRR